MTSRVRLRPCREDDEETLLAIYASTREEELAPLVVAADLVHQDLPTLVPTDNLDLALKLLGESGLSSLPVLDPDNHERVLGLITHEAVIDAYNSELLDRDLAGEAAGLMVVAERGRSVDLGDHG